MAAELHVLHINVNGIRARRHEVDDYIQSTKPDVIALNETKLYGALMPRFAGYKLACSRDRSTGAVRGGGVAILVSNAIVFSDISPDIDDMAAIELSAGNKRITIVAYYCPPHAGSAINSAELSKLVANKGHVVIVGDLNAKHQYFGCRRTDVRGEQLFDFVERHDLVVCNEPQQVTLHRVSTGYTELLDYALCTRQLSALTSDVYVGDDVGSDHLPLHFKLQLHCDVTRLPTKLVRPLAKCDWEVYRDRVHTSICDMDLTGPITQRSIDSHCSGVTEAITLAIDEVCPKRVVKDGVFRLTPDTRRLIQLKRKLRRQCQRSDDTALRTLYNNISRQVTKAINDEKRQAWQQVTAGLDHLRGRDFWQKFKMLTGATNSRPRHTRIKDENDVMTTSALDTATVFASSLQLTHKTHEGPEFCQSTRCLVETSLRSNTQHYTPQYAPTAERGDLDPMADVIVAGELIIALQKSRNRSAPGEDEISYKLLKESPLSLLQSLATLYTRCLTVGYFPAAWKSAIGVMIPKPNKDLKCASSYRPISLLNTIGKLFERVLTSRMLHHFHEVNFFNKWQRAYLQHKEAAEHLHRLGTEIRLTRERRRWMTGAVSLDVEKAFDTVWHDGLRYKLSNIGLPVKLVRLLSSFLTDRTMSVRCEHELSQPVYLSAGTPQGSVLSPLLYIIYVNDLPIHPSNKCAGAQFADDLSLWTSDTSQNAIRLRLQRALNDIELWCSIWRIKVNAAKTQLVTFTRSRNQKPMQLTLFGQAIKPQHNMKLLGMTFDSNGGYNSHCQAKAKEATSRLALLRKVSGQRWGASTQTLLILYKQYILPVLDYGSVVLADACDTHLALLQRIQNSAMRLALRADYRTSIRALHTLSGLSPLAERLKLLKAKTLTRFGASHLMNDLSIRCLQLGKN
jgi:exonuclease III